MPTLDGDARRWSPGARSARLFDPGHELKKVPVWVAKVASTTTVPRIQLVVVWMPGIAPIRNAGRLHALQDGIELGILHVEGVMVAPEDVRRIEVEGKRRVYAHRREMPARPIIGQPEDAGEKPGSGVLVTRRHDCVVRMNAMTSSPYAAADVR
jgi:hypothetical protein